MIVANSCRCAKCKKLLSYEERINVKTYNHVADTKCQGSLARVIDNLNLCKTCYYKYKEYALLFFK